MNSLQIEYDEQTKPLPDQLLHSLHSKISKIQKILDQESSILTILFCSQETSRFLNKSHRQIDKPTDILSWKYDQENEPQVPGFLPQWGELAVCLDICQKQADQSSYSMETELLRLVAHGLAHLSGYDHETEPEEKEMLTFEIKLLSSINLKNIYSIE